MKQVGVSGDYLEWKREREEFEYKQKREGWRWWLRIRLEWYQYRFCGDCYEIRAENSDLVSQIDALLVLDAKGATVPPVPALARQLLSACREKLDT